MAYCEVEEGVRLYYESYGQGETIVFVHGGGASHEAWEQQTGVLFERFRVVAYDLRGHGASDKPDHGYSMERFCLDLEALLAHLGLERVSLVCHGIGGYVGLSLAVRRPQMLDRLVLINSSARFAGADAARGGFSTELQEGLQSGLAANKVQASIDLIDNYFFFRDPGPAVRQLVLQEILQLPLAAHRLMLRDIASFDFEDRLGEVKARTLILHGRHDRKQRFSGAALLHDRIAGSQLQVLENSAHLPHIEEASLVNEALLGFLSGREETAAAAE